MAEHEIQEIRVLKGGELKTIRVREKRRQTEWGVEGVVYALLDPHTLQEIGSIGHQLPSHPPPNKGVRAIANAQICNPRARRIARGLCIAATAGSAI